MPRVEEKDGEEKSSPDRYNIRPDDSDDEGAVQTGFMAMGKKGLPKSESWVKRCNKWNTFAKQHSAFGFDKLSNAQLPQMSQKPHGITVCFEKIQGWKVPKNLLSDLNRGYCDITIQLSLSLFHMKSATFFGTTWNGREVPIGEHGKVPDVLDMEYFDIIYMISRLVDSSCIGILEVVATVIDKETNLASAKYGCGWAMISLFGQQLLHDISDGHSNISSKTATLYKGSPRDILELSLQDKSGKKISLQEMNGCLLQFRIYSHRRLLRISDLIVENAIFGRYDIIAGLESIKVTLPDTFRSKALSCIGDQEIHNKSGDFVVPRSPGVSRTYTARLSNWQLFIPNRLAFESALITQLGQVALSKSEVRPQIISRAAKMGYHNGHTILSGAFQEYSLEEDESDEDTLKIVDGDVELTGYVAHELVAMCLVMEYSVGIPNSRDGQPTSFYTIQSSTINSSSNDIVTVTIGSSIFVPYSEGKILLRQGLLNSDRGESTFDIELDVHTNSICGIVSPNRLFKTSDYLANPDDDDLPKVGFDLKMFDWNNREISNNHEDDQMFIAPAEREVDEDASDSSHEQLRKHHRSNSFDDDAGSVSELEKEEKKPMRMSLKLDQKFYTNKTLNNEECDIIDKSTTLLGTASAQKSSLMARSMRVNLNGDVRENVSPVYLNDSKRIGSLIRVPMLTKKLPDTTRDLTRGMRTRLSRHGFNAGGHGEVKLSIDRADSSGVDIGLEYRDPLTLNAVTIQFAGYRVGAHGRSKEVSESDSLYRPKAIYCSYQFYTCSHTRTEPLRILPSEGGEIGVLVRADSSSRNETPLALRHTVDCSEVSLSEIFEFADYLNHRTLYIDIWDADSRLVIGTCAIPLRRLMRQGQSIVKFAIECDIVDVESAALDERCSIDIISNGPLVGTVVGSLSIILSNSGQQGSGSRGIAEAKHDGSDEENLDLNWRLNRGSMNTSPSRPKNKIRAKPLSESQPKLSTILDQKVHRGPMKIMRSLTSISRVSDNRCTINFDELTRMFKRFRGTMKGTIQYEGPLMSLLEVPSLEFANRKFIKAAKTLKQITKGSIKSEISKFCDSGNILQQKGVKEFIHRVISSSGMHLKSTELEVLASKYIENASEIHMTKLHRTIERELNEHDWALVAKRFKSAFQQATLSGIDFEHAFSEFDTKSDGVVSTNNFEMILQSLLSYANFSASEISIISWHFSQHSDHAHASNHVSVKAVMAYVGKEYRGNIRARLMNLLLSQEEDHSNKFATDFFAFIGNKGKSPTRDVLVIDDIEEGFDEYGIYNEFTRTQLRPTILSILNLHEGMTAAGFLSELGVTKDGVGVDFDAETLLKIIVAKVKEKGVDIEATFRHFDSDGNGSLTKEELEDGLGKLQIFDTISNWRSQIPDLVNKFDNSNDGSVSIKEFLAYIGIKDYTPNILQKMTKIFAVAQDKLSMDDIFQELDHDSDGFVTAHELQEGLQKFGSFDDVTIEDASKVVALFVNEEYGAKISMEEFANFFSKRISQVNADKHRKKSEKLIQRFRNLMKLSIDKGLKPTDIFKHFDKDGGGTISGDEFTAAVKSLPHFSSFKDDDIQGLIEVIDSNGSGDVSLEEFKQFVIKTSPNDEGVKRPSHNSIDEIKKLFLKAEQNCHSEDDLFLYLDKKSKNGYLTSQEFESRLSHHPYAENIHKKHIKELVIVLDREMTGEVSLSDFRSLLNQKTSSKIGRPDAPVSVKVRELFCRHMRRIAEADGGLTGLLAYLDKECNGLSSYDSFFRLLSREGVYDTLSKADCEHLLQPITKEGSIDLTLLLRFIEDIDFDPHSAESSPCVAAEVHDDYQFSKNPEIRVTEKKLRSIGRILSDAGVNVEKMFKEMDPNGTGEIRRSEFIDILAKSGLYILEKGGTAQKSEATDDISKLQESQIKKIRGNVSSSSARAQKYIDHDLKANQEFEEHQESIALIDWYRQGQKRSMLQNALSHSLCTSMNIYPRFAKMEFFEVPIRNPFDHEEFFMVEIADPELELVTNFDEWTHLRRALRPNSTVGDDPMDPDMFDQDGHGTIHFALLPYETVYLPYKFLSLIPTFAGNSKAKGRLRESEGESKSQDKDDFDSNKTDGGGIPVRTAVVRIISGSYGHAVSILNVKIHPRPFSIDRTLRFYATENSIMRKRINLISGRNVNTSPTKFIHCVENGNDNRVVLDFENQSDDIKSTDMEFRYRCPTFPSSGSFYILVFKDVYHSEISDMWFVVVQSRLKIDAHALVGSTSAFDLVVRGDQFNRRVQAFSSAPEVLSFLPASTVQLSLGVYNRLIAKYSPIAVGSCRLHINLVDVDTSELVCSWVLTASATSPSVRRQYDVQINDAHSIHKKVIFQNVFDIERRFILTSSDETIMKPRDAIINILPRGTAILRLWFGKSKSASSLDGRNVPVFLFLKDSSDQNEETLLFNVHSASVR